MSIARYRILRRLGQGGMAEVFEAELAGELGFSRKVALKRMLESAAADPTAAKRFLDEARIASHLHHANVVSVVDLGLLDGLPFQVLELVEGLDAAELMQRAGGKLPLDVALAIAGDVAHALDHAHGALDPAGLPLGIVHRDVKPSNVLVSWGGDVKLSDFGIAVARDRTSKTEAGFVAGTFGFIAPEQRTRSQLDGRTDVFALGLTLHALSTGYTPLQDVEVEMRLLAGEPVPLDASLPEEVRAMIARAVAVTRSDRPTARELADAIGAVLAPRLTRDPRSFLRGYLAGLERRPAVKPGALDRLLGIEVVLTGPEGASVRHYETLAAPELTPTVHARNPAPAPIADAPTVHASPRAAPTAPSLRRAGPIIAAVLGLGAVGGGIAVWQLAGHDPPPTGRDAAVVSLAIDAGVDSAVAIDSRHVDAAVITLNPDARRARPTTDAGAGLTSRQASVADAASPAGTGYLQVLDEQLVGALVYVDNVFEVSVPNKIDLPYGLHRVEVRSRDGTQLRTPKTVEITPMHTRSSPAKPTW